MKKFKFPLVLIVLSGLCGCAALTPPAMPDEPKEVTSPPLAPDRTWAVPARNSSVPADQIVPSASDAGWNSKKPPMPPDTGWIAPAAATSTAVTR